MEGEKSKNFTNLDVWQKAHKIVMAIYKATSTFPSEEIFGLTSQMRRAAVSITSNIAEGFSRRSLKEKLYFYNTACGSLTELQNQIIISYELKYIQEIEYESINNDLTVIHKMLNALITKTKNLSIHQSNF